jgi:UDP-N-acetylmuramyl pentapeptide phosphotransferase/UDP-N-acetylglucosamine-1-phosphate transferase
MAWWEILLTSVVAFVASWGGTLILIRALGAGEILDHPNERSSHSVPVPRGGGIAVIAAVAVLWSWIAADADGNATQVYWILVAAIVLAALSWLDDLIDLSVFLRLPAHIGVVVVGLIAIGGDDLVFQGLLPFWLDRVAAGFVWVWFLNLFNFMDGIDGLAAGEAAAIAFGLVVVAAVAGIGSGHAAYAAVLCAAALGFWWWNADPARIFLGDVGSVALGFLLGWLLISVALQGAWAVALILPLYFLADATVTLLRRLARREPVWQAHREHFYQRAVQSGVSHAAVVRTVMVANVVLIALAGIAGLGGGAPAVIAAVMVVAMLLYYLQRVRRVR